MLFILSPVLHLKTGHWQILFVYFHRALLEQTKSNKIYWYACFPSGNLLADSEDGNRRSDNPLQLETECSRSKTFLMCLSSSFPLWWASEVKVSTSTSHLWTNPRGTPSPLSTMFTGLTTLPWCTHSCWLGEKPPFASLPCHATLPLENCLATWLTSYMYHVTMFPRMSWHSHHVTLVQQNLVSDNNFRHAWKRFFFKHHMKSPTPSHPPRQGQEGCSDWAQNRWILQTQHADRVGLHFLQPSNIHSRPTRRILPLWTTTLLPPELPTTTTTITTTNTLLWTRLATGRDKMSELTAAGCSVQTSCSPRQ